MCRCDFCRNRLYRRLSNAALGLCVCAIFWGCWVPSWWHWYSDYWSQGEYTSCGSSMCDDGGP
jgi:hypothetical protein